MDDNPFAMDEMDWLQQWYLAQCNGEWEHRYGISIETIDNPGWNVTIDIEGTRYAAMKPDSLNIDLCDTDWVSCQIADGKFQGYGDTLKLKLIVGVFRRWVIVSGLNG